MKHLPGARKEEAKEMSGEERLPEKRWRRVDVSGGGGGVEGQPGARDVGEGAEEEDTKWADGG